MPQPEGLPSINNQSRASPISSSNLINQGRSPDSKSDMARLEAENVKLQKQVKQMKNSENFTGDRAVQKTLERFMVTDHYSLYDSLSTSMTHTGMTHNESVEQSDHMLHHWKGLFPEKTSLHCWIEQLNVMMEMELLELLFG